MDRIAAGSASDRRDLFSESASRLGMNPAIVEKDFWVCWILKHLFAEPSLKEQMIFKGGTSLSKVFGLIDRFSEDIDLILDWRLLGYGQEGVTIPIKPSRRRQSRAVTTRR
jgi:Nucleotidyl transferase AbiEii toxin, Type IV TA system